MRRGERDPAPPTIPRPRRACAWRADAEPTADTWRSGDAKWDGDKCTLTVTLPVVHEWDAKLSSANDLD